MKHVCICAAALLAVAVLAGCQKKNIVYGVSEVISENRVSLTTDAAKAIPGTWDIEAITSADGSTFSPREAGAETIPTLSFTAKTLHAETGCNIINAKVSTKGDEIAIGQLQQTRMMCPDMRAEDLLATILPKLTKVEALPGDKPQLRLTAPDGAALLLRAAK